MKIQRSTRSATLLLLCSCLAACYQQAPPQAGVATAAPAAAPAAVAPKPAPVAECNACGTVRSITAVKQDGQGTGAGAVIGGIVGGVAGNQVGGGSGRQIATVAGVIGGAIAGNEVEQNRNSTTSYEVVVDMQGGGQQVIILSDASGFSPGSQVTVQGGTLRRR